MGHEVKFTPQGKGRTGADRHSTYQVYAMSRLGDGEA